MTKEKLTKNAMIAKLKNFKHFKNTTVKVITVILLLTSSNLFSQERIFWRVEHPSVKNYVENTLVPTHLPNSKAVYWHFMSTWSVPGMFTDQTQIRLDDDFIGLANVWIYGYHNSVSNSDVSFPVASNGTHIFGWIFQTPTVNWLFGLTPIEFQTNKYLPEEQDWNTCAEFLTQVVETNPDFYAAHFEVFWGDATNSVVVVTLGYPANDFAGQDMNTLTWSAAIIDTVTWNFFYCWADAYDVENISCYTSSIKEPSTIVNLLVSPNPTVSDITVSLDLETAGELTVTLNNMLGQELFEIYSGFTLEGNFHKTFSLKELPTGVYYLRISHNGNVRMEKIIKN